MYVHLLHRVLYTYPEQAYIPDSSYPWYVPKLRPTINNRLMATCCMEARRIIVDHGIGILQNQTESPSRPSSVSVAEFVSVSLARPWIRHVYSRYLSVEYIWYSALHMEPTSKLGMGSWHVPACTQCIKQKDYTYMYHLSRYDKGTYILHGRRPRKRKKRPRKEEKKWVRESIGSDQLYSNQAHVDAFTLDARSPIWYQLH